MAISRVVLIGGPPSVGKSTVARCIAARHEYGCISMDDIAKAVGSAYSTLTHSSLDPMDGMDWREHFATTHIDLLLDHAAASRERLWPAIDKIVRRAGAVLADAFQPDQVWRLFFKDEATIEQRGKLFESPIRYCLKYGEVYAPSEHQEAIVGWVPGDLADMTIWRLIQSGAIVSGIRAMSACTRLVQK